MHLTYQHSQQLISTAVQCLCTNNKGLTGILPYCCFFAFLVSDIHQRYSHSPQPFSKCVANKSVDHMCSVCVWALSYIREWGFQTTRLSLHVAGTHMRTWIQSNLCPKIPWFLICFESNISEYCSLLLTLFYACCKIHKCEGNSAWSQFILWSISCTFMCDDSRYIVTKWVMSHISDARLIDLFVCYHHIFKRKEESEICSWCQI